MKLLRHCLLQQGFDWQRFFQNAAGAELQGAKTVDFRQIVHPQNRLARRGSIPHVGDELEYDLQPSHMTNQNNVGLVPAQCIERVG